MGIPITINKAMESFSSCTTTWAGERFLTRSVLLGVSSATISTKPHRGPIVSRYIEIQGYDVGSSLPFLPGIERVYYSIMIEYL